MTATTETAAETSAPRTPPTPTTPVASLAEGLRGTRNSLGLLRLILASMVIVDHAFPLGGWGHDPVADLTRGQATLGSIAVGGFFAISGYLIAKSGMTADVLQFLWRRVLRIFPAFWGVLIVAAFVVGPVIWVLDGHELGSYFSEPDGPLTYLRANWTLTIGTYGIHDVFADTTPYGQAVGSSVFNGSLWTLSYEWTCYLIVAALVAAGVLVHARILVPLMTGLLLILQIAALAAPGSVGGIIPYFDDPYRLNLTLTFLVGSCLAVYSRRVPFDDRLGVLSAVLLLVSMRFGGFSTLGVIAGAYLVLYLGARLRGPFLRVGARNDYSYGVYVYGFLVEQVLAYAGFQAWGFVPFVLVALVVTGVFAFLSWHGIEKHAMRLKDAGPGRGWRYWFDRLRGRLRRRSTDAGGGEPDDHGAEPRADVNEGRETA